MTVNYDKSYLPAGYERFVSRGCAAEDIYHLRFNFCYTDAQRDETGASMTHFRRRLARAAQTGL